jgi:hypothetical protein
VEELGDHVRPGEDDDLLAVDLVHGGDQGVDRPVVGDPAVGVVAEVA